MWRFESNGWPRERLHAIDMPLPTGPELKGAANAVIPRIDHLETSCSAAAFEAAYRFIAGRACARSDIAAEPRACRRLAS